MTLSLSDIKLFLGALVGCCSSSPHWICTSRDILQCLQVYENEPVWRIENTHIAPAIAVETPDPRILWQLWLLSETLALDRNVVSVDSSHKISTSLLFKVLISRLGRGQRGRLGTLLYPNYNYNYKSGSLLSEQWMHWKVLMCPDLIFPLSKSPSIGRSAISAFLTQMDACKANPGALSISSHSTFYKFPLHFL